MEATGVAADKVTRTGLTAITPASTAGGNSQKARPAKAWLIGRSDIRT
jgi:hypothetical protein